MVAETTVKGKNKEKKESKHVLMNLKHSWSKIKFLSKKQVAKRFGIVALIMTVLTLFIMGVDYGLTNGFDTLFSINFDIPILKTILSVVFLILAILLIVLEVFRKQNTNGFLAPVKKVATINDFYTKAIRIISICMFILLMAMYII